MRLRAQHAAILYRSVLAYARGDSGATASSLEQAAAFTSQAAGVVARREAHYRFDVTRETGQYANPTVYPFGYLRPAHTLCYWHRRESQVAYLLQNGAAAPVASLDTCGN